MDENIMESLAGFDAVWRRVTAPGPADREDDAGGPEGLTAFIRDETCAAVWAAALARQFTGDKRAVLLRQAADARRHLRRLRAELFIATGSQAGAVPDCRDISGKLACLRRLYLCARDRAGAYGRAAEHADGELGTMYAAFAGEDRRHAAEARALLLDCFR